MPLFRTQPSSNLYNSVARLVASGGARLSPLQEMQADMAAARTMRDRSLAEKARIEAEEMRATQLKRNDPNTVTQFASHAAGMDVPSGNRLMAHLQGALEEPSPGDIDDMGGEVVPYPTGAPNLEPGQRGKFQNALTAQMANVLATGKTNAQQLTAAAGNAQDLDLSDQAARAPDAATGNALVAAAKGILRNPHQTNAQGVTTNRETGTVDETSRLAGAVRNLTAARTTTEGHRQTELTSRDKRNKAATGLTKARRSVVGAPGTGKPLAPAQVEKIISEVARKEWEAIPGPQRRGMNYQQHLDRVRERFTRTSNGIVPAQEIQDAHKAIADGKDLKLVRQRFKQRMGFDLPEPTVVEDTDDDEDDD